MAANATLTQVSNKEALSFKVFKITMYSLILLLCLLGNTVVVVVICKTRRMRIPSNLLILNLALCDLVTPLASIPFDLALEENGYIWPFGRVLCKTLWPLATLSATSASLTLAFISLDRYRVIMHPFKQRLSSKQVKYSIGMIHLVALLFVVPYIYYLDLVGEEFSCKETWPAFSYRQAYTLVLFIGQYGIPLAFMSVMYTITLCNLRSSSGMFERAQPRPSRVSVDGNMNNSRLDVTRDCQRKASRVTIGQRHDGLVGRDQNIRATIMFVTVVIVFATCRLPNEIFWLWSDFGEGHESDDSKIAGIICSMFTYTNSIFNPVIYWIFSKDFQKGFKGIFTSLLKRKRDGLYDDELDKLGESQLRKLSTLSETISFVWRKFSRSRSESSGPMDLNETQGFLKAKNNNSQETSPCKSPRKISTCFREGYLNGLDKSPSRTAKKKNSSIQFDDSNIFLKLPLQSRLAKLSEESLCDPGPEHENIKIRRFGTVQPPNARPLSEYHVMKVTRSSTDNLSRNEVVDETTQSLDLAEGEKSQPTSDKTSSSLEMKCTFDDMKTDSGGTCEKETFINYRDLTSVYFQYSSSLLNIKALKETEC